MLTPVSGVRNRMRRGRPSAASAARSSAVEVAAAAVVARRATRLHRGVAALVHLVRRAEALVRVTRREQPVGGGRGTLVEPVALQERPLVPVEAEPAERVLDPDDPLARGCAPRRCPRCAGRSAAVVAGVEPVEERGAHAADVQEPGRRGREPDADQCGARRTAAVSASTMRVGVDVRHSSPQPPRDLLRRAGASTPRSGAPRSTIARPDDVVVGGAAHDFGRHAATSGSTSPR